VFLLVPFPLRPRVTNTDSTVAGHDLLGREKGQAMNRELNSTIHGLIDSFMPVGVEISL